MSGPDLEKFRAKPKSTIDVVPIYLRVLILKIIQAETWILPLGF